MGGGFLITSKLYRMTILRTKREPTYFLGGVASALLNAALAYEFQYRTSDHLSFAILLIGASPRWYDDATPST